MEPPGRCGPNLAGGREGQETGWEMRVWGGWVLAHRPSKVLAGRRRAEPREVPMGRRTHSAPLAPQASPATSSRKLAGVSP